MVLLKFRLGELVGCGIKFFIQRVPTRHTFDGPHYPKHHHVFSGISYFWGSMVRQKYAVWVIVVFVIKFFIQQALPLRI